MTADYGQARFGQVEHLGEKSDDLVIGSAIGRRSGNPHFQECPSARIGPPLANAGLCRSRGYPNSNNVPLVVQIHGALPASHARRALVGVIEKLSLEESM